MQMLDMLRKLQTLPVLEDIVICLVPVSHCGELWPREVPQRVEEKSINDSQRHKADVGSKEVSWELCIKHRRQHRILRTAGLQGAKIMSRLLIEIWNIISQGRLALSGRLPLTTNNTRRPNT